MRGARANRLRAATRGARLRPGVYALAVSEGQGIVVPMAPVPGFAKGADPAFRNACDAAHRAAKRIVGAPSLPALRFPFEQWLGSSGSSVGLPAALAYIGYAAPTRRPSGPVLATGELLGERVSPVEALADKLAVARIELERTTGMLLAPRADGAPDGVTVVDDLDAAVRVVFGREPLAADTRLLSMDEAIERSRSEPSHELALSLLEAVRSDHLKDADRARVELERAMRLRHMGRTDEAVQAQVAASSLLGTARQIIGAEAMERYELSYWATALDEFRIEESVGALRERLAEPFLMLRNEVRCRGMLAQALGMAGRSAEAVHVRLANVPLQQSENWLSGVLPGTYCYLALDSARAGDESAFFEHLGRTFETTRAGDANQWRYDATVALRGLVLLGREQEAIAWAEGRSALRGFRAPPWVVEMTRGRSGIRTHPEVSALRALCRAFRKTGSPDEADAVGRQVVAPSESGADLVGWLAELARMETALGHRDVGAGALAEAAVDATRNRMIRLHPAASQYHADLMSGPVDRLESAIDRVWY
jgi:hypothetical protein